MDQDDPGEAMTELQGRSIGGLGVMQLAVGAGLFVYAVWAGFLMPGFRKVPLKLQVPYVPASKRQVQNVLNLLQGRSGKIVDLGSGDGRIVRRKKSPISASFSLSLIGPKPLHKVLAAYRRGFYPAVGYELNPWLLRLSRLHAWRAGCAQRVCYLKEDLWKVNLADCSNITVFLAPSVLSLLETKLLAELPNEARVISGRFPFPNWEPTATVGEGLDKVWAYDVGRVRQTMAERAAAFEQGTPV
ncbi:adenine nucleotide translocase lysine N-methyltransferase isoform X1 [Gracilinanus agilis]|uniref:adenine nucleotide translocase lysine N-methyltransferase isoform X1 n=1 Tax=Gracilinanus agilis TaxID=191870 RepID=UPI001CFCEDC4|nr:adenine nucleotide translocase lysine N-methyltransferase isoform X1 [Gracilinanus agilis]